MIETLEFEQSWEDRVMSYINKTFQRFYPVGSNEDDVSFITDTRVRSVDLLRSIEKKLGGSANSSSAARLIKETSLREILASNITISNEMAMWINEVRNVKHRIGIVGIIGIVKKELSEEGLRENLKITQKLQNQGNVMYANESNDDGTKLYLDFFLEAVNSYISFLNNRIEVTEEQTEPAIVDVCQEINEKGGAILNTSADLEKVVDKINVAKLQKGDVITITTNKGVTSYLVYSVDEKEKTVSLDGLGDLKNLFWDLEQDLFVGSELSLKDRNGFAYIPGKQASVIQKIQIKREKISEEVNMPSELEGSEETKKTKILDGNDVGNLKESIASYESKDGDKIAA